MSNSDPVEPPKINLVEPNKKKKYAPPTLTDYGTVSHLTNSVGQNKAGDGGTGFATKTAI